MRFLTQSDAPGGHTLNLRKATVSLNVGSVDIAGRIGSKKSPDRAHLICFARAPQRNRADDVLHVSVLSRFVDKGSLHQRRHDRSWTDGVDTDATRLELRGPCPRKAANRG